MYQQGNPNVKMCFYRPEKRKGTKEIPQSIKKTQSVTKYNTVPEL